MFVFIFLCDVVWVLMYVNVCVGYIIIKLYVYMYWKLFYVILVCIEKKLLISGKGKIIMMFIFYI